MKLKSNRVCFDTRNQEPFIYWEVICSMIPGNWSLKHLINRKQFKFTVRSRHGKDFFPKLMGRTMAWKTLMHVASCCIVAETTYIIQQFFPNNGFPLDTSLWLQILVCMIKRVYVESLSTSFHVGTVEPSRLKHQENTYPLELWW